MRKKILLTGASGLIGKEVATTSQQFKSMRAASHKRSVDKTYVKMKNEKDVSEQLHKPSYT